MNALDLPSDFLPLSPARRRRIEATIEALIAMLDEVDGDENLEGTGDAEPWLAGYANQGTSDDREADQGDDEPDEDGETCQWTLNPDIPQEGSAWHYFGQ